MHYQPTMQEPSSTPTKHLKFSKLRLEQLPHAAKNRVAHYYDTQTRGLSISVGSTGRKAFFLYRKINGIPKRIKIGLFPETTVEQARTRAETLNGAIASGDQYQTPQSLPWQQISFDAAFEDYFEKHSLPRKLTYHDDRDIYERNLKGNNRERSLTNLAAMNLAEINVHTIQGIHRCMSEVPVAANRTLALISSVFSHLIREGTYPYLNPCRGIRKYPERSRERFLQRDEAPFLFQSLEFHSDQLLVDFLTIALLTGVRRAYVMRMSWEEISLARAEWRIATSKNGESQTIPLPQGAVEILKRRSNDKNAAQNSSPYVFPGTGESGHLVEPKKGWATICTRATALKLVFELKASGAIPFEEYASAQQLALSMPKRAINEYEAVAAKSSLPKSSYEMRDLRVHDLRRTVGSWLASDGASLPLIGKVLNHKSPQSTQIYARFMSDPVRAALEGVAAAISSTVEAARGG